VGCGEKRRGQAGQGGGWAAAAELGWLGFFSFVFFLFFSFLFSKTFLNRILRATQIQQKGISTKIKYTSA